MEHSYSFSSEGLSSTKFPSLLSYKKINFMTTGDKINYHLDALEGYKIFLENHENEFSDLWIEMRYLLYRKYYIERKRVEKFMRKCPVESPFRLAAAQITTEEIIEYMELTTGRYKLETLMKENTVI